MPNEDHPANVPSVKGHASRRWLWVASAVLSIAILAFIFAGRDDRDVAAAPSSDVVAEPSSSQTTKGVDNKSEIIARLNEILTIRERAYHTRNPEVLKGIYTVDCPCLTSDTNAIHELLKQHYVWIGGKTSLRVRKTEQVTARMWIIIADFSSAPLRVETESGQLVREEPQGQDLFQFVLAKPTGSTQWLLGRASSYEGG